MSKMGDTKNYLEILFERLHNNQPSFIPRIFHDVKNEYLEYFETLNREERRKVGFLLLENKCTCIKTSYFFLTFTDSCFRRKSKWYYDKAINVLAMTMCCELDLRSCLQIQGQDWRYVYTWSCAGCNFLMHYWITKLLGRVFVLIETMCIDLKAGSYL